MAIDWQLTLTLTCVIAAALFLVWRTVRIVRGRAGGCGTGSCGSCPSQSAGTSAGNGQSVELLDEFHAPVASSPTHDHESARSN